jgi:hypothetical protein
MAVDPTQVPQTRRDLPMDRFNRDVTHKEEDA